MKGFAVGVSSLRNRAARSGKAALCIGVTVALAAIVPAAAAHADGGNFPNPNFIQQKISTGDGPRSIATGDFNQDGEPDLAVANYISGTVTIETSSDAHFFTFAQSINVNPGATSVVTGDFNGDHDPDLAVANANQGTVEIILGGKGASFGAPIAIPVGFFPNAVAVADLDRDSHPDLVVALDSSDGGVAVLRGLGGTNFASPVVYGIGDGAQSLAIADFNGDNYPDVAATSGEGVTTLVGSPTATLTEAFAAFTGPGPNHTVVVGDFNGDNHPDLAVQNGGNEDIQGNIAVLLGAAGATFSAAVQYPAGVGFIGGLAVGDMNNDGIQDIVATDYATNDIALLFGNGDGLFPSTPQLFPEGGANPWAITTVNFDTPGLSDLVVANDQSANITVLFNVGPGVRIPQPGPDLVARGISMTPAAPKAGDAVTFQATVTNEGDIATPAGVPIDVSFSVDGTVVSHSVTLPGSLAAGSQVFVDATTPWTATSGTHKIHAFVDDRRAVLEIIELNNTFDTTIVVPPAVPKRAVLLAGSATTPANDVPIVNRLHALGYHVDVVDDDAFTTVSLANEQLLVISSSIVPSKIPTWLASMPIPILNAEAYAQVALKIASSGSEVANSTTLRVANTPDPLAAGLSGDVQVQSAAPIGVGNPTRGASTIATLGSAGSSIYEVEKGAQLTDGTAPARRVGFFFSYDSPVKLTSAGWSLFDAAVKWLTPAAPKALLLAGSAPAPANDVAIVNRLSSLGYDVTVVDDDAFTTASLAGEQVLIISSSIVPSKVPSWLANMPIPTLNSEAYAQVALKIASSGGEVANSTTLRVATTNSPLAAGLSGDTIVQYGVPVGVGTPARGASVIAQLPGAATASIYGIEQGAQLTDGTAAARRVGFFFSYSSPVNQTFNGWALFDAAVGWLLAAPGSGGGNLPT
ncbi:MAG TPA: FG-GAP-like repeat-containing protein [Acidimicrobiia bacterium]|nr:FG-GAP-like repeat-containing protein [Acidimicrobiia bacterium]